MILISGLYLYAFLWTRPDIGERNISKKKKPIESFDQFFQKRKLFIQV